MLRILRADDLRGRRRARLGVDDHAQRVAAGHLAHRQGWIVGEDRADADKHGVRAIAESVHFTERALADEVAAAVGGHTAIEGRRELHDDERAPAPHATDETLIEAQCLGFEDALLDLDTGGPQLPETLAVGARVRIAHGRDHAAHARREDRVDTRRSAAVVGAWLERRVQRRAPRVVARFVERAHLRVRLARGAVISLAHDRVATNDDRAHHRVGTRTPCGARRETQRTSHVLAVLVAHRL